MALLLGEREVHNGGMSDGSARVHTDGQSSEAQVTARTAAGVIHVYGAVASRATTDRDTSRARGFGFVALPESSAVQDARTSLHGTSVAGRALTVTEAPPHRPRWETAHHLPQPVTLDHRSPGVGASVGVSTEVGRHPFTPRSGACRHGRRAARSRRNATRLASRSSP